MRRVGSRQAAEQDRRPVRRDWRGYAFAAAVVAVATLLSGAMLGRFDRLNLVMVYLLGVVLVATRHGRGPSAFAAVASVALFDFFFVPPHLTFVVADTQYLVSFAVMLVVGLLVSTLAARVRDAAEFARQRERRTQALLAVSRDLVGRRDQRDVAATGARHVADLFRCPATVLLPAAGGRLEPAGEAPPSFADDPREQAVAAWAFTHGQPAGAETDTLPAARARYQPLTGSRGTIGVLGVELPAALRPLSRDQRELLVALAAQVAVALERAGLAAEADASRLSAESERLRSTLLSSVSHDLRTPLAAITGAAAAARKAPARAASRAAARVLDEAERLNRLVGISRHDRLEAPSSRSGSGTPWRRSSARPSRG
jgi:two-component system sensor histidine kinase KdpD